jgi:T5SS/PEP-CTERM-associated repeat protein
MKSFRRGALLTTALTFASPALADFINEPFSFGLGAVNITGVSRNPTTGIYALSGPVFDATGRQLQIGNSSAVPGGVASLTLNNQVGTYDVIGIDNVSLTHVGRGSAGALTVDGAGAFINSNTVWFGLGNSAEINITNGGVFSGERTFVGLDNLGVAPGDVTVTVDGAGSRWETETVTIGSSAVATPSNATVTVSNGGVLSAAGTPGDAFPLGQIYVGGRDGLGQTDTLTITGTGSLAEASEFFGVIGGAGDDILRILDGGAATAPTMTIGSASVGGAGSATLLVSGQDSNGTASSVTLSGDLDVGFGPTFVGWDGPCCTTPVFEPADGRAIVENGGVVNVGGAVNVSNGAAGVDGRLTLASGGTINGDVNVNAGGLLDGNGGSIFGNLAVNGGTLAPGASPGSLFVGGNLDLIGALVELEIGGTAPGQFDSLTVLGDLIADATTTFRFSLFGGYTPTEGDSFDLFDVGGLFDASAATFDFSAFGNINTALVSGGQGQLTLQLGQGSTPPSPVPLPAGGLLLLSALGALGLQRRRTRG